MSSGRRAEIPRYWMEKAEEALESARSEYSQSRLAFCANRLYYAAFYAVSAVLAARGLKYGKHSAVRSAFHRDLVKTGLVDLKYSGLYDHLFYNRQEADYQPFAQLDEEVVENDMREAGEFVAALRSLLEEETG